MNALALIPVRTWLLIASHGLLAACVAFYALQAKTSKHEAEQARSELVKANYNAAMHANNAKTLTEALDKQNAALDALKATQDEVQKSSEALVQQAQAKAKTAQEKAKAIMSQKASSVATQCNDAKSLFDSTVYAQ